MPFPSEQFLYVLCVILAQTDKQFCWIFSSSVMTSGPFPVKVAEQNDLLCSPAGTSVSISTFNLVAIALERYSAICKPLKSRAWQTQSHAYRVIAVTWVLAFVIMIPYPIISHLRPFKRPDNTTAHQCRHKWPVATAEQTWYVLLLLVLFAIPGVVMIVAYGLISRKLYQGIRSETALNKESTGENLCLFFKCAEHTSKNSTCNLVTGLVNHIGSDGCYVCVRPSSMEMNPMSASTQSMKIHRPRSNTSGANLEAKKRVIRMLVVIVVLFFLCWMPLYCVNTWRAFDNVTAERALSGTPIAFIHLLSYTSACVNPIIYCFMNMRFRKALLGTFSCCFAPCCQHCRRCRPRDNEEDGLAAGASMSRFSYTIVSTMGTC
uniref:Gastrin/cholecystokinin type B receptor n=1 Tax=Xiphophorus couchianus TaxID=32473 RepID=A0A3B5MNL1_9TELE